MLLLFCNFRSRPFHASDGADTHRLISMPPLKICCSFRYMFQIFAKLITSSFKYGRIRCIFSFQVCSLISSHVNPFSSPILDSFLFSPILRHNLSRLLLRCVYVSKKCSLQEGVKTSSLSIQEAVLIMFLNFIPGVCKTK